jgi:pseudouridine kinase
MPKVVVIGGANIDIKGRTDGPAIEATSNPGTVEITAGGVGRNIAHNLALLGLEVSLVAMVGDDTNADVITAATREAGVDVSLLQRVSGASGTYLAVLDQNGELISAINAMGCADRMTVAMIEKLVPEFRAADFLVADCNIPETCLGWVSQFAARGNIRLLIEPVSVPKASKLKNIAGLKAYAVTPNRDQAEAIGGSRNWAVAVQSIRRLGIDNVVIHAGAEGAYLSTNGNALIHIETAGSGALCDVTGAGDAAVAGLVWGLVKGYDMRESACFGQRAAAIKLRSTRSVAEVLTPEALLAMGAGN